MTSSRISVALTVVAAFVAGIWVGTFISGSSQAHSETRSASPASIAASQSAADAPLHSADLARHVNSSSDPENLTEKFWTTLTIADERERQMAWLAMLSNLTAENAMDVRELFRKMDAQGRWFVPEWNAFWARWGEVDGPAALAQVNALGSMREYQPMLAERIVKGWATKDPAGARAWLLANTSSSWYEGALRGFLDGQARTNLDAATQDAIVLGKGRDMGRLTQVLTEQALQQRQLSGMLEWWQTLPDDPADGSARREAVAHVFQRLMVASDGRANAWLAELAGTPYRADEQIGSLAETIAEKSPAGALTWVTSLPPSPSDGHYTGIGRTVRTLAQQNPATVEEWLNKLPPSPLRDQGLVAYARHLDDAAQADAAQRWRSQVEDQQLLQSSKLDTGLTQSILFFQSKPKRQGDP